MNMKSILSLALVLACQSHLFAQDDIPLLLPEERQAVDEQADEFNHAIQPALADASKSTVRVWSGSRRLAYGTVIGDGTRILTKWSEIARARGELRVDAAGNESRDVKLFGVYEDEDLVLLEVQGKPLTPVKWSFETPKLGGFLAAPQPDGRLAAFGVVSVPEPKPAGNRPRLPGSDRRTGVHRTRSQNQRGRGQLWSTSRRPETGKRHFESRRTLDFRSA